ncbi:MAG: sulfotransferase [Phycisphaeraceae bacterium]
MTSLKSGSSSAISTNDPASLALAPVFIVGAPRSGTTWLQRLLLEHPAICGGQESHFFVRFGPVLRTIEKEQAAASSDARAVGLLCYWQVDALQAELRGLWCRTMRPVIEQHPEASVLLEKSPAHALFIDEIRRLLPAARFIHLIRDSRAVTASILAAGRDGWVTRWGSFGARRAAHHWRRHVAAARQAGQSMDASSYMELHYEALHRDASAELQRVFAFLKLPCTAEQTAAMVEAQRFDRQKQTGGSAFVIGGELGRTARKTVEPAGFFRRGQTDSWRQDLNVVQRWLVWRITRHLMRDAGYDTRGWRPTGTDDHTQA